MLSKIARLLPDPVHYPSYMYGCGVAWIVQAVNPLNAHDSLIAGIAAVVVTYIVTTLIPLLRS